MSEGPAYVDVLGVLRDRSATRAFAPEPPADAELASLFVAAGLAPSSGNAQPWRFVLTRRDTEAHTALADALHSSNRWASAAPILVATVVRTMHDDPKKPPKENRLALLELGLATGNLLAQATSLGLVARPVGGFDRDVARSALAVPDGFELGVLVAIGHPGDSTGLEPDLCAKAGRIRERRDVVETVFEGRWGHTARISSEP